MLPGSATPSRRRDHCMIGFLQLRQHQREQLHHLSLVQSQSDKQLVNSSMQDDVVSFRQQVLRQSQGFLFLPGHLPVITANVPHRLLGLQLDQLHTGLLLMALFCTGKKKILYCLSAFFVDKKIF